MEHTRLFYVVDAPEVNEEIFETLSEAQAEYDEMEKLDIGTRLYIAEVKHAYIEEGGALHGLWNYDDYSNTFNIIKILQRG